MPFVAAICPQCGANIQLPDDRASAKCMYCGVDIETKKVIELRTVNVEALHSIAEIALAGERSEEAYSAYTRILEQNPDDAKAWFGKAKSALNLATLNDLRCEEVEQYFVNAIDRASDESKIKYATELTKLILIFVSNCEPIIWKHFIDHGGNLSGFAGGSVMNTGSINDEKASERDARYERILNLAQAILVKTTELDTSVYANILDELKMLADACMFPMTRRGLTKVVCHANIRDTGAHVQEEKEIIVGLPDHVSEAGAITLAYACAFIQQVEPDYPSADQRINSFSKVVTQEQIKNLEDFNKKNSTCFIATAAYGDLYHPDVVFLRHYRDSVLSRTLAGRKFIKIYWIIGPQLAKFVNNSNSLKKLSVFLIKLFIKSVK